MWVSLWQNVVPETPTELGKTSKKLLSALGFFFFISVRRVLTSTEYLCSIVVLSARC